MRTKNVLFVQGTFGKIQLASANAELEQLVEEFKALVDEDPNYRWQYEVISEKTFLTRLFNAELKGHTIVFNSSGHAELAKACQFRETGRPGRIFVLSGEIPLDEIVWLNKAEGPAVLANAIKCDSK